MARTKSKKKSWQVWLQDNPVVEYLRNTRAEMHKVHWPTRSEAENLTKIVLGVTVAMALFMGALDYLFSRELHGLITGNAIAIGAAVVVVVASIVLTIILNRQSVL